MERLKVLKKLTRISASGMRYGLYQCFCGTIKEIANQAVASGNTRSCGCQMHKPRHGLHQSKEYAIWASMKDRCLNPNSHNYKNYGGRGIKVAGRWLKFENFYADIGPKPEGYSLDRIDNDKGYSRANCRWATKNQQSNNTRSTRYITYQGQTKPLQEWAKDLGINHITLAGRLRRGWTIERAVEQPIQKRK